MVGVARIELATPAMSTQGLPPKAAEIRRFFVPRSRDESRTDPESRRILPRVYRAGDFGVRVLVACERSGVVRRAFERYGHDAWSCDLEPADDRSNRHIRGNVLDHLDDGWDLLAVMHPPCTILCNSGVKWLYIGGKKANGPDPTRWAELEEAAAFYRALRDADQIPRRAIENPVMHGHAIDLTRRGKVQFVQPWWFGDPFFKATGLELIGLAPLRPTDRLTPPKPGTEEHKAWSRVHREPPGPDRARRRSETFPGMADAFALQWGGDLVARMAA